MNDSHLNPTVSKPPEARPPADEGAPARFSPWWGRVDVPEGACARVELGPLVLHAQNLLREWRLYTRHDLDPTRAGIERDIGHHVEPPDGERGVEVFRFAQTHEEGALWLTPRLADRPMVARPEIPISLIGGDEIALFVSTPLWAQVETADTHRRLSEIPTLRPSDTWFGASPREGELCYAMRTRAKLVHTQLQRHPVRAITRIDLKNHTKSPFRIERLNLPIPYLHLYLDEDGLCWTNPVGMERLEQTQKHAGGRLRIVTGPPAEAKGATLLGKPRVEMRGGVFVRAFDALFG
ncbi:MAG: hypothetical protein R3F65_18335 [bacterium]